MIISDSIRENNKVNKEMMPNKWSKEMWVTSAKKCELQHLRTLLCPASITEQPSEHCSAFVALQSWQYPSDFVKWMFSYKTLCRQNFYLLYNDFYLLYNDNANSCLLILILLIKLILCQETVSGVFTEINI